MQPKILRALQERTVRAVGANAEVPFDVRLVTATNRETSSTRSSRSASGSDLFYRINVVKVVLPPLRARGGDVLRLAAHFLEKLAREGRPALTLSESIAAEKLMAYSWPGNVRELRNCIERAVAMARFDLS